MGAKLLKFISFPLRLAALLVTLYILAVCGYHLQRISSLSNLTASPQTYAITILSGLGALWALVSLLTACFIPRALFLPILFFDSIYSGAHIAIAILLRPPFCSRTRKLWTKSGEPSVYHSNERVDCGVDKGAFGAACAAAILFALLAFVSWGAWRSYLKNRAFGPGPDNGYSSHGEKKKKKKNTGYGRKHRRGSDEEAVIPAAAAAVESGTGTTRVPTMTTAPQMMGQEVYTRPAGYREPAVPMSATGGGVGTAHGYENVTNVPQTGSVHLGGGQGVGAFDPELKGGSHGRHHGNGGGGGYTPYS